MCHIISYAVYEPEPVKVKIVSEPLVEIDGLPEYVPE
jgi:hypothetical protein